MDLKERLKEIIKTSRKDRKEKEWRGTVLDFLQEVKEHPELARSAHGTFYHVLVEKPGWKDIPASENPKLARALGIPPDEKIRLYDFIQKDFFGMEGVDLEGPFNEIVHYAFAAKEGGEESRQLLYLRGPVGGAKSSFVDAIKLALEDEELYVLEGCPQHDHPFWILPRRLREKFSQELGVPVPPALDICPICRERLQEEFKNNWEKFPVVKTKFSKRRKVGITSVKPVDPNNQDVRVLIGSEKIRKMHEIDEGDPRGWKLNGALNRGNRGMVEWVEIFKNEREYTRILLTATQEKVIPSPGYYEDINADSVYVVHSNWAEWERFRSDLTEEAMIDRMKIIDFNYVLRMSAEAEIYKKLIMRVPLGSVAHLAPHLFETAAAFTVLSRFQNSEKCSKMTKLRVYDGEEVFVAGSSQPIHVSELKAETPFEGREGISTRFAVKAIDEAIASAVMHGHSCVNPLDVFRVLYKNVLKSEFDDEKKKEYLKFLVDPAYLFDFYLRKLKEDCLKTLDAKEHNRYCQLVLEEYLKNVILFTEEQRFKEGHPEVVLPPSKCNFGIMAEIESQLGMEEDEQIEEFRKRLAGHILDLEKQGKKMHFRDFPPLHRSISLIVQTNLLAEMAKISKSKEEEDKERFKEAIERLKKIGYCKKCATVALQVVSGTEFYKGASS